MDSFEGIEIVFDEQNEFSPIWFENNWNLEELLGIDKITGTLSIGKEADIIAITNNPLTNIQNIQDVVFVMNNGRIGLKRIPFDIK